MEKRENRINRSNAVNCSKALLIGLAISVTLTVGCSSSDGSDEQAASNQNRPVRKKWPTNVNSNTNAATANNTELRSENTSPQKPQVPAEILKQNNQAAPEDSTYSISLTNEAVETRIFKKHPVLAKVEKRQGSGEPSVTVFLRDGKTVQADPKKIAQLKTASTAEILAAAGINSPAATSSTTKNKKPN